MMTLSMEWETLPPHLPATTTPKISTHLPKKI
jgi:hypothetical protein